MFLLKAFLIFMLLSGLGIVVFLWLVSCLFTTEYEDKYIKF